VVRALVLAGARSRKSLVELSQSRTKAAIRLYGRPLVEYVLNALLRAEEVEDVTVAGAPDLVSLPGEIRRAVRWVPGGASMARSLELGLEAMSSSGPVLVVACDLPLLLPEAVDDFVRCALRTEGEVVYPLVPRRAVEALARGAGKRSLWTREGTYAAGNVALVRRELSSRAFSLLERAHRWRKDPWTLGQILGWDIYLQLGARRMSLADLEARVRERSGVDVRMIAVEHGSLGFDLDSPKDLLIALRSLAHRAGRLESARIGTTLYSR